MMEEFPFSAEEWDAVGEASLNLTNATLADDEVLHASLYLDFFTLLDQLQERHGEHPILLETYADFSDDPLESKQYYAAALQLARDNSLPTYTICISFADLLLNYFDDAHDAADLLNSCRAEIDHDADDHERQQWSELVQTCASAIAVNHG